MKKILCIVLALLMILSSLAFLFSCSDDTDKEKKDPSKNQGGVMEDDGSIFYERSLVDDELGEEDYGGRDFRVVAQQMDEIFIEEEERNQGNLLKDATYARNNTVENRFNINIDVVYNGTYQEINDYVSKTVLSGTDEFDLLMGMVMSTGGLVTKNLFLNWYDIEHIDFSKPWWYESNTTDLTYDNKNLIAISHLNRTAVGGAYCLYFNKDLAAAYDLGDLYGLVLDGKWTFDKFTELIKDIYIDDGNDKRDDADFYGLAQGCGTAINSYLWAFDNPTCAKDEDGVPKVSVKTDKVDSIIKGIYDLCYNTNGVYFSAADSLDGMAQYADDMFYAKQTIFFQTSLATATGENMRNFESDYGLLPLPKWNEDQAKYTTMVGGHHTCLAVPKTCRDTEFVGRIVEALSAESWKTITPTLYETALKTRYLRDNESKEVMDLIIDGTQFDFGTVYDNWQGFSFMLQFMMRDGNSNFESYYQRQYSAARLQYKMVVKAFDKVG